MRFDTKRIAELPVGNQRDIFSLALSAAGVSQTNTGQASFASGPDFATNGMRARSNNFMIDGQDSNDVSVTGRAAADQQHRHRPGDPAHHQPVRRRIRTCGGLGDERGHQERHQRLPRLRLLVHQPRRVELAEQPRQGGRAQGGARPQTENQYGGTLGGPVVKDKTFFFGSYQRWTRPRAWARASPSTARPPRPAARCCSSSRAAARRSRRCCKFLPAAQTPIGTNATFTLGGQTYVVPLGSITGSADQFYNGNQYSGRIDHRFSANHNLGAALPAQRRRERRARTAR